MASCGRTFTTARARMTAKTSRARACRLSRIEWRAKASARMREYQVTFVRSASKELEALPRPVGTRVLAKIEDLATTPRPAACRKLAAANNLWRLRVGDYRVV